MRNVAPSRAIDRRARQAFQLAFFVFASGLFAIFVGLAMKALPLSPPSTSPNYSTYQFVSNTVFIVGLLAVLVGIALAIRAAMWAQHTDNDLARVVANVLAPYLDDRYTFIRNISKVRQFYIDAVLIGVQGVLVFRIMDDAGNFLNERDRWLRMSTRDGRWVPARIDPTRQCAADVKDLQTFLAARGLPSDTPIYGVVVFVKDDPIVKLTLKDPVIPATHLGSLYTRLQPNYFAKERISAGAAQAIARLLYDA